MKTNLSGKCTHVIQVRFAGTRPVPVLCGEPGKYRPSLIHNHTGIFRCTEHHVEFGGGYHSVAEDPKLNSELPIPGVW